MNAPSHVPSMVPALAPGGLLELMAPAPSMALSQLVLNAPSIAPTQEAKMQPLDISLAIQGDNLLPYDEAKQNATVLAVANILKVSPFILGSCGWRMLPGRTVEFQQPPC